MSKSTIPPPIPVFLLGKFHGQRILVGYCPWGHKESDTTEHTHMHTTSDQDCFGADKLRAPLCLHGDLRI